jgi:hypothetical protein
MSFKKSELTFSIRDFTDKDDLISDFIGEMARKIAEQHLGFVEEFLKTNNADPQNQTLLCVPQYHPTALVCEVIILVPNETVRNNSFTVSDLAMRFPSELIIINQK